MDKNKRIRWLYYIVFALLLLFVVFSAFGCFECSWGESFYDSELEQHVVRQRKETEDNTFWLMLILSGIQAVLMSTSWSRSRILNILLANIALAATGIKAFAYFYLCNSLSEIEIHSFMEGPSWPWYGKNYSVSIAGYIVMVLAVLIVGGQIALTATCWKPAQKQIFHSAAATEGAEICEEV